MAKSKDRHKKESLAIIASQLAVSAETARKCRVVNRTFSDGEELLMSGRYRVDKLYKLAKGDKRVGLHILINPELREAIKMQARENGISVTELINNILTKIFW
jgi:hypothetical protein